MRVAFFASALRSTSFWQSIHLQRLPFKTVTKIGMRRVADE